MQEQHNQMNINLSSRYLNILYIIVLLFQNFATPCFKFQLRHITLATSKEICKIYQLTGFYKMGTLAFNEVKAYRRISMFTYFQHTHV